MKSFNQFLLEYPISDIRYFKDLPDTEPDAEVLACVKKYRLDKKLHWKEIHNKTFTHSREMDDGIIAMVADDIEENWYHELGHEIFDHSDKEQIIPILDRIKEKYGLSEKGLKWLELGGYDYSYSHSGKEYEHDELFAISFAFYEGDKEKFTDSSLHHDFQLVLDSLRDNPLFNENPYTDHDSAGTAG